MGRTGARSNALLILLAPFVWGNRIHSVLLGTWGNEPAGRTKNPDGVPTCPIRMERDITHGAHWNLQSWRVPTAPRELPVSQPSPLSLFLLLIVQKLFHRHQLCVRSNCSIYRCIFQRGPRKGRVQRSPALPLSWTCEPLLLQTRP